MPIGKRMGAFGVSGGLLVRQDVTGDDAAVPSCSTMLSHVTLTN